MKHIKSVFYSILLVILSVQGVKSQHQVIQGTITNDIFLTADKTYLLRGFVYVKNGATFHIEPGTIVYGEKQSKGTLIITKSGKINAEGTVERPIVFTSNQAPGSRDFGDWGGVMILGAAPTNCLAVECAVEGGVNNAAGDGLFGGTNPTDSSGVFRYCRIEFAGIPFQPDNEINGLTMAGVGNKTIIDHIQVSFSGDDAFEWFGGTVNCSHLVSYICWDDDFDTDFGYTGKVQFAFGLRGKNIADVSLSNGFESDNSKYGDGFQPFTSCVFSNVTLVGALENPFDFYNPNHYAGMQLTRNTKLSAYNSIVMGFPIGLLIDGESCETNAATGDIGFKNNILAGNLEQLKVITYAGPATLNINTWFTNNSNTLYANNSDVGLIAPFNIGSPNPMPSQSSPALSGANFSGSDLNHPYFTQVNFRGAFGSENWMEGWTNFDPQNTTYFPVSSKKENQILEFDIYPNPSTGFLNLKFHNNEVEEIEVKIHDLLGKEVFNDKIKRDNSASHFKNYDLNYLDKGVYLFTIQDSKGKSQTQKFIIK
jgi:hypothetical protein